LQKDQGIAHENTGSSEQSRYELAKLADTLFQKGDFRPILDSHYKPALLAAILNVIQRAEGEDHFLKKIHRGHRYKFVLFAIMAGLMAGVGGASPYLDKMMPSWNWIPLGYLFFVAAGSFVFVEKIFGFSISKVRTAATARHLRKIIEQFKNNVLEVGSDSSDAPASPSKNTQIWALIKNCNKELDDVLLRDIDIWGKSVVEGGTTMKTLGSEAARHASLKKARSVRPRVTASPGLGPIVGALRLPAFGLSS
jgi:hypothetical protein